MTNPLSDRKPIPEWALKPGTTVLMEPGGYHRDRQFIEVTITRVTKASVFVKSEKGHERRFVPSTWNNDQERMMEYGQSTAWSPGTYIWNPTFDGIKKAIEQGRVRALEVAVAKAATALAEEINRSGRHVPAAINEVRRVIEAYEAGTK